MQPLVWKVMLDDVEFVKKLKETQQFARDTGKKLQTKHVLELEINKIQADQKVKELRNMLKNRDLDSARRLMLEIDLTRAKKQATEAWRLLNNYLNTWDTAVSRLSAKFEALGERALSVGKAVGIWAANTVASKIGDVGKKVIELADNYEQAKNSFTTMLGSAEQAEHLLAKLSDFAKKTPFELTEVRENAKQLLAMGISADNLIPTMKALWDVSAGLGVPMQRLALNYGQVMTKGKLAGQELKDFTTAGVPLLDELSKNLGKSKAEIQNMVSKGQISADMVTEAFRTMTSEWGRFADLMATQSGTLSWMRSNLSDSLAQIGEKIWLFLLPGLKDSVDFITRLFDKPDNEMEAEIERLSGANREMQKVIQQARQEMNDLNEDLKNGKISATNYNSEFDRLSGIIAVAEQDIAKTNVKIKEQSELIDIATSIAWEHTETLNALEGKQNVILAQLQELNEKQREGIITEEEYTEQKKLLLGEYQNLEQAIGEENKAHKKENDVYRMLKESGMKVADIKSTLANLRINNGADISALSDEQKAANAAAMSYVALAKSKVQAEILEKKNKLSAFGNRDKKWRGVFADFKDDLFWGDGSLEKKKKLKEELKFQEEYLAGLEKIEKEQNAFFSGENKVKWTKGTPNWDDNNSPTGWGSRGSKKDPVSKKKEELKKLRDLAIDEIQQSGQSEKEKYKNILKINEDYKKKLVDLQWKTADEVVKKAEDVKSKEEKIIKDKYQDINKAIDKSKDHLKKYGKEVENLQKKREDSLKGVKNEIRDLNHELQQLDEDYFSDMAERYVQVQEALQKDNLEREERNKLQQELNFLMEKTTEEQRKQAEETAKLSESQKRELDYQKQKATLQEKINIAKAFSSQKDFSERKIEIWENEDGSLKASYTDEKWEVQKVVDYKNIQYLADLANKQTVMKKEMDDLKDKIEEEFKFYEDLNKKKEELEKKQTEILKEEMDKRKEELSEYTEYYEKEAKKQIDIAKRVAREMQAATAYAVSRSSTGKWDKTTINNNWGNTNNTIYNINNPSDASLAVLKEMTNRMNPL